MNRHLAVAAATIVASFVGIGAASAQGPVNYYVAVPAAQPAKTRLVTNSTAWRWENNAFVASKAPQRDPILCAAVAKRAGTLASFTVAGQAFDAEALAKCNASAR